MVTELGGIASPPSLIRAIEAHLAGCFGPATSADPLLGELPEFSAIFPQFREPVVARVDGTRSATIARWWWVASGARASDPQPRPDSLGYTLHHRRRGLAVGIRTSHQRTLMPRGSLIQVAKTAEDRQWVVDLWSRCGPAAVSTASSELADWLAAGAAREPEARRVLIVWSGGRPVATVGTRRFEDVVGVFGLCVLPELRRAGLGRALIAAALRRSEYEGARWAVTAARFEEEPFYLDFGFAPYCEFDVYRSGPAPLEAAPLAV